MFQNLDLKSLKDLENNVKKLEIENDRLRNKLQEETKDKLGKLVKVF